jgi:RNA polymerase sigma-70 factor (ECF subfamily)
MDTDIRKELVLLLPRLRRFAYSLCGSIDEADDLVQAACLKALGRLDQFEPGSRLDSWMFRILQTGWIDRTRSAHRRYVVNDDEQVALIGSDARIYEQTEARDALAVVRAGMAFLPAEQRTVLALVAIDGRTYQEAADILEVPIGTIMSRLARARRRLAEALEQPALRARSEARP